MKNRTCHQVALLLLFHFSGTGWGQVTASITGVVRDVTGAVAVGGIKYYKDSGGWLRDQGRATAPNV